MSSSAYSLAGSSGAVTQRANGVPPFKPREVSCHSGAATTRVLLHSASTVLRPPSARSVQSFLQRTGAIDEEAGAPPVAVQAAPLNLHAASRSSWAAALVPVNRIRSSGVSLDPLRPMHGKKSRSATSSAQSERQYSTVSGSRLEASASAAASPSPPVSAAGSGTGTAARRTVSMPPLILPRPPSVPSQQQQQQQQSRVPKRKTVLLISADEELQVEIDWAAACESNAIRMMLGAGGGGMPSFSSGSYGVSSGVFQESAEGVVRLPSVRGVVLAEVAAFLQLQASARDAAEFFRPFHSISLSAPAPTALLVELLSAAHFLDLLPLQRCLARLLALSFLELPPLRSFPDDLLALIVAQLEPNMLYVAERKLWAAAAAAPAVSGSGSGSKPSIPTRALWHVQFERLFGTSAPPSNASTALARHACLQHWMEHAFAAFNRNAAPHAHAAAHNHLYTSAADLALVTPRTSHGSSISADALAASAPSSAIDSLQELRNWTSFLAPELCMLQLRNGAALEPHLHELLPHAVHAGMRLLDLSNAGFTAAMAAALGRCLRAKGGAGGCTAAASSSPCASSSSAASPTHSSSVSSATAAVVVTGLDLARCGFGSEGLQALCAAIVEQTSTYQRRSKPHANTTFNSSGMRKGKLSQLQSHSKFTCSTSSASPSPTSSSASASPSPSPSSSAQARQLLPSIMQQQQQQQQAEYQLQPYQQEHKTQQPPPQQSYSYSITPFNPSSSPHSVQRGGQGPAVSADPFLASLQRSMSTALLQRQPSADPPQRSPRGGDTASHGSSNSSSNAAFDEASYQPSSSDAELRRQRRAQRQLDARAAVLHPFVETDSSRDDCVHPAPAPAAGLELCLRDNAALGDAGLAQLLSSGLQHSCWIRALDLSANNLGHKGAHILADCLRRAHCITYLNVGHCHLGGVGVAALLDALCAQTAPPFMQLLDIRNNFRTDEQAVTQSLCQWLSSASSVALQNFSVGGNGWSADGLACVSSALASVPALRILDLSHIDMSSSMMEAAALLLAQHMADAPSLQALSLAGNRMQSAATAYFAQLISNSATLTSLDLGGNCVDAYCAAAFGAAFALNAPLTALSLAGYAAGKRMRSEGCVALARGLASNQTLTSLDLSHHGLRNSGVAALCGVLPQCKLRYVNLQKNHIQQRGAMTLANCLQGILSSSSSWFDPHSSQSAFVWDLSLNALDARAISALHACQQQAAMLAASFHRHTDLLEEQPQQQQALRGNAGAPATLMQQPRSIFRADWPSTPAGSSVSPAALSNPSRAATAAVDASSASGCSLWVWPSLRTPAFGQSVRLPVARVLQQAGCVAASAAALHVECAHQILPPSDQTRPDPAHLWLA